MGETIPDLGVWLVQRPESDLNFPLSSYKDQLEKLRSQTLEEIQAQLLVRFRVGVEATSRCVCIFPNVMFEARCHPSPSVPSPACHPATSAC